LSSEFYSPDELSELINMPLRTLETWRYNGEGPAFHRFGTRVRYAKADVDRWLAERRIDREPARARA
jgi:excisionase family DNA binding protein